MNKYAAWFMILCSMAVMQWHGAHFWRAQTGDWITAAGFSFSLEVAMLSLFYLARLPRQWPLYFVSIAAAILLIAGPWYQVSNSVFDEIGKVSLAWDNVSLSRAEAEQMERSLDVYQDNSKKYKRAADRIEPTEDALKMARENYHAALKEARGYKPNWRLYIVAAMQGLGFLIVLTAQLAALVSLRTKKESNGTSQRTVTVKRIATVQRDTAERNSVPDDSEVYQVADRLRSLIEEYGSKRKLCAALGIRSEYVKMILEHSELIISGGRVITVAALENIKKKIGL